MPNYLGRTEKWTHFGYAPPESEEPPHLAKAKYFRAPEGLKIELLGINISAQVADTKNYGIIQLYLGHKPLSQYGLYPHIEDQDVIFRFDSSVTANLATTMTFDLFKYEVKQFTVMYRSSSVTYEYRPCIIIYYRLMKFIDTQDKLEYAVKQPKLKKSKGLGQLDMVTR